MFFSYPWTHPKTHFPYYTFSFQFSSRPVQKLYQVYQGRQDVQNTFLLVVRFRTSLSVFLALTVMILPRNLSKDCLGEKFSYNTFQLYKIISHFDQFECYLKMTQFWLKRASYTLLLLFIYWNCFSTSKLQQFLINLYSWATSTSSLSFYDLLINRRYLFCQVSEGAS